MAGRPVNAGLGAIGKKNHAKNHSNNHSNNHAKNHSNNTQKLITIHLRRPAMTPMNTRFDDFIAQMHGYFRAEKWESLIFMCIGVLSVLFAVYAVLRLKQSFYNGMSIPFVLIGLVAIVVGGTVFFRSDKQASDLEALLRNDAAQQTAVYLDQELPRMRVVNNNFDTYKLIEIACIGTGIALMLVFNGRLGERAFWLGLGVGLFMQAALMLSADIFAEKRADEYTARIEALR
jgi:hypothetical protein